MGHSVDVGSESYGGRWNVWISTDVEEKMSEKNRTTRCPCRARDGLAIYSYSVTCLHRARCGFEAGGRTAEITRDVDLCPVHAG